MKHEENFYNLDDHVKSVTVKLQGDMHSRLNPYQFRIMYISHKALASTNSASDCDISEVGYSSTLKGFVKIVDALNIQPTLTAKHNG